MSRTAPDGIWEYDGYGGPLLESVADALELMRDCPADWWPEEPGRRPQFRYDGSVICLVHPWMFWRAQAHGGWRYPVVVKAGRRAIDWSTLLPDAARELHIVADPRVPRGRSILETPDGKMLARIND